MGDVFSSYLDRELSSDFVPSCAYVIILMRARTRWGEGGIWARRQRVSTTFLTRKKIITFFLYS